MANDQAHNTATDDPDERATPDVTAVVAAVVASDLDTFAPQSGFSISGTLVKGNVLTVTKAGGGFGTKPGGEKPVYAAMWEDGHDSKDASDLSRDTGLTVTGDSGATVQGDFTTPGGVNALEYVYDGSTGAGQIQFFYTSTGKEIWFSKRQLDFDEDTQPATGDKAWRLWSGSVGNHNLYFDTGGKFTAERTDGSFHNEGHRFSAIKDRWGREKCRLLQGDLDVENAKAWWIMDGVEIETPNFYSQRTIAGSGNSSDRIGLYNFFVSAQEQTATNDIPAGSKAWNAMLYMDDSWCHAVLTDSATFSDESAQEVQPIDAWADGTVAIVFRPYAGLNHLHIVDSNYNSFYVGER
jgi:hypothetical protein